MPIMEITVVPVGTQSPSLSSYVTRVVKVLEGRDNIHYELTSMGTIIEADSLRLLFDVAHTMHTTLLKEENIHRVLTSIKIDDRTDKKITMDSKTQSVKNKLKEK